VRVIRVQTYDGSDEAMHPDVIKTPSAWGPGRLRMVVTPYPHGEYALENPSVYASEDGVTWSVPSGARNPIAVPTRGLGHLSDPAAVFDPESEQLWVYYRSAGDSDRIWLMRTRNGATWSEAAPVLATHRDGALSPTIVRRGSGEWEMWTVDAGRGCLGDVAHVDRRTSTDGRSWSAPIPVALNVPWDGFFPWHIAVTWVPVEDRYWALFNVKRAGDCATPALFVAVSRDGAAWITFPQPLLERGAIPEFQDLVYRSSLLYDEADDAFRFWYSGARRRGDLYVWSLATQRLSRASVRDRLRSGPLFAPLMSRVAPARDTVRVGADP
jgi:hypothetical protein